MKYLQLQKLLLISLTSIFVLQTYAQNVSIGTTNAANAKLTVEGAVGQVVGLFKNGSGISVGVSASNESIGLNMADGKAIATGNGGRLLLTNSVSTGGIGLQYYASATAGSVFSSPINILRHTDNLWAGSGHWIDMIYNEPGRIRVANQMYNSANGAINLLPLGIIHFNITNLHNGENATRVIKNAGDGGSLLYRVSSFTCSPGNVASEALLIASLELDWITKEYDDIYIVGSPNFEADGEQVSTCSAKFYRLGATSRDIISIKMVADRFWSFTQLFGTLMMYGNRTSN